MVQRLHGRNTALRRAQLHIVEELERRRIREGWTITELAHALGISYRAWTFLREGKITLSSGVLSGVVTAFPDMESDVMVFLREAGSKMPELAQFHSEAAAG